MKKTRHSGHTAQIYEDFSIREVTLEDAGAIWQVIYDHREYLKTWLPFVPALKEVADEEAFLSLVLSEPYEERNVVFVIEKNRQICGLIGFAGTDIKNHRTEIGYWLLPDYHGKGVMTRCVRHLCQWAVESRGINRIQIRCAAGNHASNAIPQRLGFFKEGTEREGELLASGVYVDINVYSILKGEVVRLFENTLR